MRRFFMLLTALIMALCQPACAQEPKPDKADPIPKVENPVKLQKGDRIVFFGDSITAAGASSKTGYVNIMKNYLNGKYKDLELQVHRRRHQRQQGADLQAASTRTSSPRSRPSCSSTSASTTSGTATSNAGTPKDKFEAGLKEIIGKIQNSGARVILCTPSVIGEKTDGSNKHDAKLDEYADVSRAVAKEMKVEVCDLRQGFMNYLKANNPNGKKKEAGILTTDRVHLNPAGDRFVAEMMLRMLGESLPPSPKEEKKKEGEGENAKKTVRISVNETKEVKASTGLQVMVMNSDNAKAMRVEPVKDDSAIVRIIGIAPGTANLTITDVRGIVETIEVNVVRAEKK